MDRRAFVGVAALASLPLPKIRARADSAPVRPPTPRPGPVEDMDAYLSAVDAGMAKIADWSITSPYPDFHGDREATDQLARTAMQTLYLTGMFEDLPQEQQLHPGMQQRMWAALPLMDDAVERMHGYLGSRTDEDLATVQAAFQGTDGVAEQVGTALADAAAGCGTSAWRCEQLRAMASQAAWRLANQPPSLLIDEYQSKIERVDGSDIAAAARERWLASKVGEAVFWGRAAAEGSGALDLGAVVEPAKSLRDRRIARGVKAMGIGLLIFAAGAGLVAAGSNGTSSGLVGVGLVTGTVGAIWFLVGVLTLLVGLATSSHAGQLQPAPSR